MGRPFVFLQSLATTSLCLSLLYPGTNANLSKRQALSPPADLPTNWSYKGCYTDSVGQRSLGSATFADDNQSAQTCIEFCTSAGYSLAGTEYSRECFCGNSIGAPGGPAPDGEGCNMACSGAPGEACGGPNRLSLYERTAAPPAQSSGIVIDDGSGWEWVARGCYSDLTYARILSLGVAVQGGGQNNSAQSCTAECKRQNFAFAGTEYAAECYCGNSLNNGHVPQNDGCNMRCNGDKTQFCGGPDRINIYEYVEKVEPTPTPSTTPSSTPTPSPTPTPEPSSSMASSSTDSTPTDQSSSTSASSDVQSSIVTSSESSSSMASESSSPTVFDLSSSSVSSDSSTISSISSVTPTPTPEPKTGWYYEGCYVDGVGGRSLPQGGVVQGQMTNEKCRNACRSQGYVLAGTEYFGECYCGNVLVAGGAPAPDGEAMCNTPCNGNQTEMCGGPNRLSLFRFYLGNELPPSSTAVSSSSAAPVATGLPDGFEYKGCYVDGPGYRVMQNQQPDDPAMTIASCSNKCATLGYDVAGMEYHTQCFCDTQLRMGAYLASDDSQCNTNCGGNPAQMCGGGDRLSIWSSQETLKITKKPAPYQEVGNWTYQGCVTSYGGEWEKPLPWKMTNTTGNTPSWCLNRCAKYGYMAAGLEYGEECYCGDLDHMVNAEVAPESECSTPCPGDPEAICGQGNRLTWYKYTAEDPLYVFNYPQGDAAGRYEFLVGGPVIPLISQPLINGKVSFLEKHGTGPNGTGAYELDPSIGNDIFHAFREMNGLKTDVFCAASLTMPDRAGRVINIGGWSADSLFGVRLYWPDGTAGVNGTNDWQENYNEISLQIGRWYPTSMVMANGSMLVVGGENGSNGPPVPNMEILPRAGGLKHAQYLVDTDPYNLYPFLMVLPSGGIMIQYYNEARILDERTLDPIKILPKLPGTVNDDTGGRTYPLEGTQVLLPQVFPYDEPLEVLICGGAGRAPAWGIDNCVSTQPDLPNPEWTIERMPSRRVMSCMTTLPDGTFLILNGAEQGAAGFGLANTPNLNAILYDTRKPKHHRMSIMGNTTIARMYHSEAVLMDDGRVLVSGSDPEDDTHPQEYRLEVFLPPYLTQNQPRPSFTIEDKDWINDAQYTFQVTGASPDIKVSLLGSEASTHGNSMGARVLFPRVNCASFPTCTVTAPSGPYVAPPGWYRMFVLNNDIPSHAAWVRIGGDPGSLGDWPNTASFQPLPGVGPVTDLQVSQQTVTKRAGQKFRA